MTGQEKLRSLERIQVGCIQAAAKCTYKYSAMGTYTPSRQFTSQTSHSNILLLYADEPIVFTKQNAARRRKVKKTAATVEYRRRAMRCAKQKKCIR